eukprot:scaffold3513_cov102-Cylindrotheca_fusiformis.AAC.10
MRGAILFWWLALSRSVRSYEFTGGVVEESSVDYYDDDDDDELDCAVRRLIFKTAKKTVPWRKDFVDIFDALELNTKCQESYVSTSRLRRRATARKGGKGRSTSDSAFSVFVHPDVGNDAHSGNHTHPFSSFERALKATRDFSYRYLGVNGDSIDSTRLPNRTIVLHGGVHFLRNTVELTPMDSNLLIVSAPNQMAWFSGGKLIKSKDAGWAQTRENSNIWVADLSSLRISDITGLFTLKGHNRMTLARFPNANVEEWDHPNRYISRNDVEEWIFPPFGDLPKFYSIDLAQEGNPTGHIKNDSIMDQYNSYGTGQGGACASVWGDLPSYWCSNLSGGGWAEVDKAAALAGRMNIPKGIVLANSDSEIFQRARRWNNATGAVVHVAHTQGWAWHMFNVSNVIPGPDSVTVNFDKGGSQGGRNWQCKNSDGRLSNCDGDDKKLSGGEWYVEGVLEELDAPGEFFFDRSKKLLYFYPKKNCNATTAMTGRNSKKTYPIESCSCIPDLVASNLQTMINIKGTMENPVQNIRIRGLGFRDAAKTYMEQWAAPSGGDWALHRGGAIHLEGTEGITISDSLFRRLDGNAIMLSGYCKYTRVARSEFEWIGNGAIATWGDTDGYNATSPTQPRFSVIEENVMSNLGLYQKQSSGWGQNKACLNTIRNNVMFNLPRAAINFNDGLGGGNLVKGNVIFNTCRESGDHGPINSWDRMPFLTNTSGNGPSFTPLPTYTTKNIIMANYGASEGFDNDDGSSWYYTHDNVFYLSDGFKMDYGGHDSKFANNLVYAKNKHCFGTGSFREGHADAFFNNTCIVIDTRNPAQSTVGTLYQCSTEGMNPTKNRYFTVSGNATWSCLPNPDPLTLHEMQQKGFEANTIVGVVPDTDTIVGMAKNIIGV